MADLEAQPAEEQPPKPSGRSEPVLPSVSADESGVGWGDWREEEGDDDERFLREVPPHHGTY
jgi:hypothetical protein